jgi:DNA-binding SARP family transcriptional activator
MTLGPPVEEIAQDCDERPSSAAAPMSVKLLGGFAMQIAGRPVDLAAIKPRPRAVLRLLALNAGRPVHREVLAATFWPDADPATSARNVHVALSGLRKQICPVDGSGCGTLVREGDAYRLVVPPGGHVDLLDAEEALSVARAAHGRKDAAAEAAAYRCAIELARGDLLPEDGPADWVVYRREETRAKLSGAAFALAGMILTEDPNGAAEACGAGLRLDPHHDGLWRLLIVARERAGDQAAAATARQGYERMLAQLGLTTTSDDGVASRTTPD